MINRYWGVSLVEMSKSIMMLDISLFLKKKERAENRFKNYINEVKKVV